MRASSPAPIQPTTSPPITFAPNNSSPNNWIYWGGLWLPIRCATEHFLLLGAPGSGKSTLMQLQMQSILTHIRIGTNRRALVYDAKRDTLATLLGMGIHEDRIIMLNPFDQRCAAWDMAKDIPDPATAMEIATLLVPDKGEVQRFFPEAARSLIGAIIEAFLHTAPGQWTLRDVVLSLRSEKRMKAVLKAGQHTLHIAELYLTGTDAHRDIVATIENVMRRLAFVAAAWDHATNWFSLENWIRGEHILLLGSNPCLESTVQQLNSAIFHRASQILLNQPEARFQITPPQTWIFIDELRRAGKLANLPEFMVECRSKGVCIALCFQDIAGLMEVYGHNLCREIMGIPQNRGFLKTSDPDTAEYASRLFGQLELEVERSSSNWGSSTSRSHNDFTVGWQSGGGRQLINQSRPAVGSREFMKIPQACPQNGVSGYFDLASIGAPYYCTVSGDFITEHLARPHLTVSNVIYRPRHHQILREWEVADLHRLGLQALAEQLLWTKVSPPKRESGEGGSHPNMPNDSDEDDGLAGLLPRITT